MMTTETNDNSGGTGYSAGNDFTIKPLTTTVDIKLVRRLMATWHTNGLTDSNIRKILLLYFGEPAWMNLDKVYDRNMFGQIAKGMNFHSRHSFIEAILKSTGFGFIWKNKRCYHTEQNLMAFYSPIWHVAKENEVENEQISDENSNENMQNGVGYYNYNNIYIKKNIKKNNSNNVSRNRFAQNGNPGNQFSPEQKARIEAAAKSLINYIATDQGRLHQHRGNHQRNYAEADAGTLHRQEGGMPCNLGYPSVLQRLPLPLPAGAQRKNDEDSYAAGTELLDQEPPEAGFHAEEDFCCRQRYPSLSDAARCRDASTEPPYLCIRIPGQGDGTEILRRQEQRRNHQADPNTESGTAKTFGFSRMEQVCQEVEPVKGWF